MSPQGLEKPSGFTVERVIKKMFFMFWLSESRRCLGAPGDACLTPCVNGM